MKIYQLTLLCFIRVAHVSAHATAVAHCEKGDGSLRVFVAHWHGDNQAVSSDIVLDVTVGENTVRHTVNPAGQSNNYNVVDDLPGCASGNFPILDKSCGPAYNDWGYWDFAPNSCDLLTTNVTLVKGTAIVFAKGCPDIYPTTISVSENFGCVVPTAAPSTAPSFESVSHDMCENFAVHARTTVTFDGDTSEIYGGDVGVSPGPSITGSYTFHMVGEEEKGHVVLESSVFATSVTNALDAALEAQATAMEIEIGGKTFVPGTYRSGSAINFAHGTVVTLDGLNQPNPVFLFVASSTLVTAANTYFVLINGAKAENVYWALGTAATLGANSVLEGSILAGTAITVGTNAELHGCALAQSAVTFESGGKVVMNHYEGDDNEIVIRHLHG
jgi:hypothetical protein